MCIHHFTQYTCGHTYENIALLIKCYPVIKALEYYHTQPSEAKHNPEARCYTLSPMKHPSPCGATYMHPSRTITLLNNPNPNGIRPEGWTRAMTLHVRNLFEQGEDVQSIIIILETEYPHLVDRISEVWVHGLQSSFHGHGLIWQPPSDLQNDHLAGDVITETSTRGCGRPSSSFSSPSPSSPHASNQDANHPCWTKWENGYGGIAYCPFLVAQHLGTPMSFTQPNLCSEESGDGIFLERVEREKLFQGLKWRHNRMLCDTRDYEVGNHPTNHHTPIKPSTSTYEWPPPSSSSPSPDPSPQQPLDEERSTGRGDQNLSTLPSTELSTNTTQAAKDNDPLIPSVKNLGKSEILPAKKKPRSCAGESSVRGERRVRRSVSVGLYGR